MHPGYIAGYVIFLAVMIVIAIFMYAYNTYTKNRIFSKTKLSIVAIIIFSLLIACFSIIGGYFAWHLTTTESEASDKLHVIFSFILVGLCIGYLVSFIVITIINNKNKINYSEIPKIDWQAKIEALKSQIGNVESLKNLLKTKHKKYYQQMLSYYETILNNAKNKKIFTNQEIADIITFNDAFSHKWSRFLNSYQLLLTYQYCAIFAKNLSQK